MKFVYMNDEQKPINVFKGGLGANHFVCRLNATEMKVFEYKLPKGATLWVKKWPDYIMISHVEKGVLKEIDAEGSESV